MQGRIFQWDESVLEVEWPSLVVHHPNFNREDAHILSGRQRLTEEMKQECLPQPFALAGEIDCQASEMYARHWMPRQAFSFGLGQRGGGKRSGGGRVIAENPFVSGERGDEGTAQPPLLILRYKGFEEVIERLLTAIEQAAVMRTVQPFDDPLSHSSCGTS